MQNTTPLFPSFHLPTRRGIPRSARQESVGEVAETIKRKWLKISLILLQKQPWYGQRLRTAKQVRTYR